MVTVKEAMLEELQEEGERTKRVLERIPADKLAWKPHPKSMSLGQLAIHLATAPGNLPRVIQADEFDAGQAPFETPQPASKGEILAAWEQSAGIAEEYIKGMTDAQAMGKWRVVAKGKEMFSKPRYGVLRTILFNHLVHHRGQLSVYLRLLDVPVPVIYGRSADENPFA
jgi:uncharacterized damage-inducible protein DinB